jgi:hypothetical protein
VYLAQRLSSVYECLLEYKYTGVMHDEIKVIAWQMNGVLFFGKGLCAPISFETRDKLFVG